MNVAMPAIERCHMQIYEDQIVTLEILHGRRSEFVRSYPNGFEVVQRSCRDDNNGEAMLYVYAHRR